MDGNQRSLRRCQSPGWQEERIEDSCSPEHCTIMSTRPTSGCERAHESPNFPHAPPAYSFTPHASPPTGSIQLKATWPIIHQQRRHSISRGRCTPSCDCMSAMKSVCGTAWSSVQLVGGRVQGKVLCHRPRDLAIPSGQRLTRSANAGPSALCSHFGLLLIHDFRSKCVHMYIRMIWRSSTLGRL